MLLAWLVTAGVLIPVGQQLTDVQQDDTGQWLPRSAEATMAYERERAAYPESRATPAIVVYVRDGGLTAADRARVDADREELAGRAWQTLRRALDTAEQLPDDLARLLRNARRGRLQVGIELAHLKRVGDQIDRAA